MVPGSGWGYRLVLRHLEEATEDIQGICPGSPSLHPVMAADCRAHQETRPASLHRLGRGRVGLFTLCRCWFLCPQGEVLLVDHVSCLGFPCLARLLAAPPWTPSTLAASSPSRSPPWPPETRLRSLQGPSGSSLAGSWHPRAAGSAQVTLWSRLGRPQTTHQSALRNIAEPLSCQVQPGNSVHKDMLSASLLLPLLEKSILTWLGGRDPI